MLRIKELRLKAKYSQKDIAKYLGITQQAYANYERFARQPDYTTLEKLADLFNVTIDCLLGRENKTLDKQLSEIEFALFDEIRDLTDEEKQKILDFAKFTKSMRDKK